MNPIFQKKIPVILLVIQSLFLRKYAITTGITSIMNRMLNTTGATAPGGIMRCEVGSSSLRIALNSIFGTTSVIE